MYVPNLSNMDDLSLLKITNEEEEEAYAVIPEDDPFEELIKKKN